MNYKMMGRLIAQILLAEAAFMVPGTDYKSGWSG